MARNPVARRLQKNQTVTLSNDEVEDDEEPLLRRRPEPSPWTGTNSASGAGLSPGMYAGGPIPLEGEACLEDRSDFRTDRSCTTG